MLPEQTARIERATWKRYGFYLDLAVMAIFALAMVLTVRHSFHAGAAYERGELGAATSALWLVVADTAFLVASLAWIFYRFFSYQHEVLTRRF